MIPLLNHFPQVSVTATKSLTNKSFKGQGSATGSDSRGRRSSLVEGPHNARNVLLVGTAGPWPLPPLLLLPEA